MDHAFEPGQEWTTALGDTVRIVRVDDDRVFYRCLAFAADSGLPDQPADAVYSRHISFIRKWTLAKEAS